MPKQKPNMPPLPTLDQRPTWVNARGGIDRSACVEIRVSEVRRLARCVVPNNTKRWDGKGWTQTVQPLPNETSARNGLGRVCTGTWTVTAHHLYRLHVTRPGRELAGDYRTTRANTMRGPDFDPDAGFRIRRKYGDPTPGPKRDDTNLPDNPNRAPVHPKMIGLHEDWTQPLRIEKWLFPERIRPAYYLICPGPWLQQFPWEQTERDRDTDPRLPPTSTCGPGRKARGCPQRCLKLMLVQCSEEENRDAVFAQRWIQSIPPGLHIKHHATIQKLLARYGPIMEPRTLLCPRCLGVKYGNDPENSRQSWWRRKEKNVAPKRETSRSACKGERQ